MATSPLNFYGERASDNTQRNIQQSNQNIVNDQQRSTLPYSMAIKGLQDKLATIDKDKDPQAYNDTVDQIQGNIHAIRQIFHPDAKLGAADWLQTHTTDRMHITNHDQRVKDLAAQNAVGATQDHNQAQAFSQATQPDAASQYAALFQRVTGRPMNDDEKMQYAQKQGGIAPPPAASETEQFVAQYKKEHPNAGVEEALRAHTEATTKETTAKGYTPMEAGGVYYGVKGPHGEQYMPDANGKFPDGTPPEVAAVHQTITAAQAKKQADAQKNHDDINSRFAQSLADRGSWTVVEGENGATKLFNPKTREMRDAPGGLHKSGYFVKQIAPLEAASLTVKDYIDGKVYDGAGDLSLQHAFFTATQPSAGFRMTKQQQDILQNSQSWLNSAKAKAQHAITGTWFSDEQRQQIAKAAQEAIENKKRVLSAPQGPKTQTLTTPAPPLGQSKGQVSIEEAMKKPKYAGKSREEVANAITQAGYTPI